jgi:hypothetical protein
MSQRFDIDPLAMQSKAVMRAMTAKVSTEQRGKVARAGLALAKEFYKADRYKEALAVITAVGRAASRVKDKQLVVDSKQLAIESRTMAKQHVAARRAMETLENKPDDAAANTAVGKYLCFAKGDWDRGLPLLAKGDDAKLKELATLELAAPTEPNKQIEVGDAWWDLRSKPTDASTTKTRLRAAYWYKKALTKITSGLQKARIKKRLEQLSPKRPGLSPWKMVGVRRSFLEGLESSTSAGFPIVAPGHPGIPDELAAKCDAGQGRIRGICRTDVTRVAGHRGGWFGKAAVWSVANPKKLNMIIETSSRRISPPSGTGPRMSVSVLDARGRNLLTVSQRIKTARIDIPLGISADQKSFAIGSSVAKLATPGALYVVFSVYVRYPGEVADTSFKLVPR